jgi:hypothetical protein
MPQAVEVPTYSLTGRMRYPKDALLDMAKLILRDLIQHKRQLLAEADDEEKELELVDELVDIKLSMHALDVLGFRDACDANSPNLPSDPSSLKLFDDFETHEEEMLLRLGRVKNAHYVCHAYSLCAPAENFATDRFTLSRQSRKLVSVESSYGRSHRRMIQLGKKETRSWRF